MTTTPKTPSQIAFEDLALDASAWATGVTTHLKGDLLRLTYAALKAGAELEVRVLLRGGIRTPAVTTILLGLPQGPVILHNVDSEAL